MAFAARMPTTFDRVLIMSNQTHVACPILILFYGLASLPGVTALAVNWYTTANAESDMTALSSVEQWTAQSVLCASIAISFITCVVLVARGGESWTRRCAAALGAVILWCIYQSIVAFLIGIIALKTGWFKGVH